MLLFMMHRYTKNFFMFFYLFLSFIRWYQSLVYLL